MRPPASPTSPAKPADGPGPSPQPARLEAKHAPYDTGPWYAGRQAWQRALASDKKR